MPAYGVGRFEIVIQATHGYLTLLALGARYERISLMYSMTEPRHPSTVVSQTSLTPSAYNSWSVERPEVFSGSRTPTTIEEADDGALRCPGCDSVLGDGNCDDCGLDPRIVEQLLSALQDEAAKRSSDRYMDMQWIPGLTEESEELKSAPGKSQLPTSATLLQAPEVRQNPDSLTNLASQTS